jgi:hypothetical protein
MIFGLVKEFQGFKRSSTPHYVVVVQLIPFYNISCDPCYGQIAAKTKSQFAKYFNVINPL